MTVKELSEKFEFREIRPDEAEQAAKIEQICFPPNEACTEKMMRERVAAVPDLFLVAVDPFSVVVLGKFRRFYFSTLFIHSSELRFFPFLR